jgi:hypothetical protein
MKHSDIVVATKMIRQLATAAGYSAQDTNAGLEHFMRKQKLSHPPDAFDNVGRFEPHEQTSAVRSVRTPSRAWPYSPMKAARTADHCAEVFGAKPIHVKRIATGRPDRAVVSTCPL